MNDPLEDLEDDLNVRTNQPAHGLLAYCAMCKDFFCPACEPQHRHECALEAFKAKKAP